MAFVNFWKLPAAQYNAEEHGGGIFQCSDDPTLFYVFGLNYRMSIDQSKSSSKLLNSNLLGYSNGIKLSSGLVYGSPEPSNDETLIFMDDFSNSKLKPEIIELLPEFLKSLYQQQTLDNGILYIWTLDNSNEPIAVCQWGDSSGNINTPHAIFLMDQEGNQYFNKVTGDSFHLKEVPSTSLNDLADTNIPCAKQVKEAVESTDTALENHKNDQDKKHIPEGGHERQILSWESEGTAKWEDLANVFTGLEEILAYGVQWNTTVSDPHLTRIGNMSLHKTLPIQSQLKGCIAQGNQIMYWLDENDWKWRKNPITQNMTLAVADGVYTIVNELFADNRYKDQWLRINNIPCKVTAINTGSTTATLTPDEAIEAGAYDVELGAVLNGYDGTVRVYCPNFYIKSYSDGNIRKVYISTVKIDNSWTYQHEILVDAYRCTVLNTVPQNMGYLSTLPVNSAISVVNTESYCRGGGNRTANDTYLTTDPFRTDLGKPRTSTTRANMRTYARNTDSELLSYEQYKNIFYWLWVIEYANFNSQEAFNEELTAEGYHQGGLGAGVTDWQDAATSWSGYNGTYPLTPCGYCNEFGNFTGVKDLVIPETANGSNTIATHTFHVPRWRGFDNPFGDIWTNLDGVLIDTPTTGASDTSILPTCYIIIDPEKYTDSLEGVEEKADRIYKQPHNQGCIKEWHLGDSADIVPESIGGNTTQYKCDYYQVNYDDTPETLLVGGYAAHGGAAGLGRFGSNYLVSYTWTRAGFRSVSTFMAFPLN